MIIENKFSIGETVYLKNDVMQEARIVLVVMVMINNVITYRLGQSSFQSEHYEFEITAEKDLKLIS